MAADSGSQAHERENDGAAEAAGPVPLTLSHANPAEFDQVIHGRIRLGVVSILAVHDRLGFTELRDALGTTDGNLSTHARKLEEAGYIACEKFFEGRVPRTEYWITELGRDALGRYLDHMEALIGLVREG